MEGIHVWRSVIERHEAAPLVREREAYLAHLQTLGVSRRRLSMHSALLLQVVRHLGLTDPREVTHQEVTDAGTSWCNSTVHRLPPMPGPHSRRNFEGATRQFLRFSKLLAEPAKTVNQYTETLNNYLLETSQDRRLSAATQATARSRIGRFLKWLAERRASLAHTTVEDIDAYLDLKRATCSNRTVASEAGLLQDFFNYAKREGLSSLQVKEGIRPTSSPRTIYVKARLSWDDVRTLLSSFKGAAPHELRAQAIIVLCALYGLRSSEVTRLTLDSFDWVEGTFSLTRAKRGRAQHYPILPELRYAVSAYLSEGRPETDCRALFLSLSVPRRPIVPALVSYIVRARIAKACIQASPAGAHALRRACATQLLNTGSSLQEIADFLGHRNLKTVSHYVRHDEAALREVAFFEIEASIL